ncbi:polyribonucleotide nucleotidyltransferase [Fretibacterium sp. OH1220_COT-178]|uniref:polyribonucleotide nucleotidyltransferase n=1 Tax=Fretibacterium sp. OH1220_COT-178 TaxID=2491047 RepID=UPI000F5D5773|nr:polyribonucleotide nucleotidyltransferase [Fretibacterium sp. OH1220_COT-178]RRD64875.1 polyribonucleotide nucleotidyltransferase [Fretibacterium sp. OH1220_COT-178]
MEKEYSVRIGEQPLVFRTGKVAKQANGAVLASHGETVVLTTACVTDTPRTGIDFFPLLVDFEERYYSAGKIPGGFIKREGRPSESAILSARVTDRSIRSLFDDAMRNDVHVVSTVMAMDQAYPPNVLGINAASAALSISGIPWGGPVGAVRIGLVDDKLVVNPSEAQMADSRLELLVAGHDDGITMVESGSHEVSEEILVDALDLAHSEIRKLIALFRRMKEEIGKPEIQIPLPERIPEIDGWVRANLDREIDAAVRIHEKKPRYEKIAEVKKAAKEHFAETFPDKGEYIAACIDGRVKDIMRAIIVDEGVRVDGRAMDELRPILCETGILPRVHGSALFTRGETQALAVTTLGMVGEDDQVLDGIKLDEPAKRFILHYNFPPYSVGEVRPMRGPGRREIGHGALAERALRPVIPTEEEFPYVVRVVSDILESNGSSSQASVCGGSLSMMHAGVPLRRHVAGIAMGLIKEGDKVRVLTDIQGLEDHYGDMDFKVAGTRLGVTALQMDNKAGGITREILQNALSQAKKARMEILDRMEAAISVPDSLSPNAPRILKINIDPEKIRDVIGPGGKTIRGITQKTGVKMNVEDTGEVSIAGPTQEQVDEARSMVLALTKDLEAGEIYWGTVTRLMAFGAFVECLPGKEGLLHLSEMSTHRVPKVEDVFKPGDRVLVMVKEIDDMGRVNLTRRRLLADENKVREAGLAEALPEEHERDNLIASIADKAPSAPRGDRPSYGGDRGDRDRGGRERRFGGDRPRRDR